MGVRLVQAAQVIGLVLMNAGAVASGYGVEHAPAAGLAGLALGAAGTVARWRIAPAGVDAEVVPLRPAIPPERASRAA